MKKSEIVRYAVVNSLATALYIILIATFMFYGIQGFFVASKSVFIPIVMLMLFVLSAAITGSLIFGRPIMFYIDGKKKEALTLLFYTFGAFMLLTVLMILIFIIYSTF